MLFNVSKGRRHSIRPLSSQKSFSRFPGSAKEQMLILCLAHGQLGSTPLYDGLGETHPKKFPARLCIEGRLVILQVSYLFFNDGLYPRNGKHDKSI